MRRTVRPPTVPKYPTLVLRFLTLEQFGNPGPYFGVMQQINHQG